MLCVIASSRSSCDRGGKAATAAMSGCGVGSIRFAVERISGPVCQVISKSSLFLMLNPSSFSR